MRHPIALLSVVGLLAGGACAEDPSEQPAPAQPGMTTASATPAPAETVKTDEPTNEPVAKRQGGDSKDAGPDTRVDASRAQSSGPHDAGSGDIDRSLIPCPVMLPIDGNDSCNRVDE